MQRIIKNKDLTQLRKDFYKEIKDYSELTQDDFNKIIFALAKKFGIVKIKRRISK